MTFLNHQSDWCHLEQFSELCTFLPLFQYKPTYPPHHTHLSYVSLRCTFHCHRYHVLGLSHWDPYAVHRGGLELYYCNMVEWFWWDSTWSRRPTGFLQCFDTVGLVIWPVKVVPEMTYNVSRGTLSLYTTTTILIWCAVSRADLTQPYDKQYLNMQIVGKLKLKLRLFDLLWIVVDLSYNNPQQ